jgi:hypothetical protein
MAYDEDIIPFNPDPSPTNDPVNDPVLICWDDDTIPDGIEISPVHSLTALYDEVTAYDEDTTPSNPVPSPTKDPVILVDEVMLPATFKDPLTTRPNGKLIDPEKYDAVAATSEYDDELTPINPVPSPINDPVNEPVLICTELDTNPEGFPVMESQSLAPPPFNAYDAVSAYDEDIIPSNPDPSPINDPVNEPVLICSEEDTIPDGIFDNPV